MTTDPLAIEVVRVYIPTIRLKITQAAEMLAVTVPTINTMIARGVFSTQRDGTGKAAHRYLMSDELMEYAEANARHGHLYAEAVVRQYRERIGRG
jgi:hypothetical protein